MRRLRSDHGAVAVVVALASVVLFGFAAMVIDAGAMFAERRQLQTGADAGALAVTDDCVESGCTSPSVARQVAAEYIALNASSNPDDRSADLEEICSTAFEDLNTGAESDIGPCDWEGDSDLELRLRGLSDAGANYVAVTSGRREGQDYPGPMFSGVLEMLTPGAQETIDLDPAIAARSVVAWGGPAGISDGAFPLTISYCEWAHMTASGGQMPAWPLSTDDLLTPAVAAEEQKIVLFNGGVADAQDPELRNCSELAAGTDLPVQPNFDTPGGFGWTTGAKDGCTPTDVTDGEYFQEGGNTDGDCSQLFTEIYEDTWNGSPRLLYMPVYASVSGDTYVLQTYVGFVLTGYRFATGCGGATCARASQIDSSLHPADELCSARDWGSGLPSTDNQAKNQNCLTGLFVKADAPPGAQIGGPSLGVAIVDLIS